MKMIHLQSMKNDAFLLLENETFSMLEDWHIFTYENDTFTKHEV